MRNDALFPLMVVLIATFMSQSPKIESLETPLEVAKSYCEKDLAGWSYGAKRESKQLNCVMFVGDVIERLCKQSSRAYTPALLETVYISNIDYAAEGKRLGIAQPEHPAKTPYKEKSAAKKEWQAKVLDALVTENAPSVTGVVKALVDAGFGTQIPLADAQPGDFIQYWYQNKKSGHFAGHSAMIASKDGKKVTLIGAHASILASKEDPMKRATDGGIGVSIPFNLPSEHAYVVRWKP